MELLEEIWVEIDALKPGLTWEDNRSGDESAPCRLGDEKGTTGNRFTAMSRTTRYVPTAQEWEQWYGAIVEIAGEDGYVPHDQLPLKGENRNVRLYTDEGDWLQVAMYQTGGFSFRMQTICAPIA